MPGALKRYDGADWVTQSVVGSGAEIIVSETEPTGVGENQLWYDPSGDPGEVYSLVGVGSNQTITGDKDFTGDTSVAGLARWGDGVFDVTHPNAGADPTGVADSGAAINTAIAASALGDTIVFPSGTYICEEAVKLLPNRKYVGSTWRGSTLKMKDGANLDAVVVSNAWITNQGSTDNSVVIQDLKIDGNRANNTSGHGLILMAYHSILERVQITATAERGLWITAYQEDTTEVAGGDGLLAPMVRRCQIYDTGKACIFGDKTTDGWVIETILSGNDAESQIELSEGCGGWFIVRNHLNTGANDGIRTTFGTNTTISQNIIHGYGNSDSTLDPSYGIRSVSILDEGAFNIHENHIQPNTTGTVDCHGVGFSSGASNNAHVNISGNNITGKNRVINPVFHIGSTTFGLVFGNHGQDYSGSGFASSGTWSGHAMFNDDGPRVTSSGDLAFDDMPLRPIGGDSGGADSSTPLIGVSRSTGAFNGADVGIDLGFDSGGSAPTKKVRLQAESISNFSNTVKAVLSTYYSGGMNDVLEAGSAGVKVFGKFGCNGQTPVAAAADPGTAAGTDAAVINAIVTALRDVGIVL